MVEIGKKNSLLIIKKLDFGIYLDGEELGEILMPKRYVPKICEIDDYIEVFLYLDSEDRIIATTKTPFVEIGKCAHLEVVSTSKFGAFLNWGLEKDLLVPFKEQRIPMLKGKSYTVYVFLDVTGRICATSKISKYLKEYDDDNNFNIQEEVSLIIASRSDLGYKAVINNEYLGLIHNSDLLDTINIGEELVGYIKKIREDGKIDLTLQATNLEAIDLLAETILEYLKANNGVITLTDGVKSRKNSTNL